MTKTTTLTLELEGNDIDVLESVLGTAHTAIEYQLGILSEEIAKSVMPVIEGGVQLTHTERSHMTAFSAYLFEQKVMLVRVLDELEKARQAEVEKPMIVQPGIQKAKKLIT